MTYVLKCITNYYKNVLKINKYLIIFVIIMQLNDWMHWSKRCLIEMFSKILVKVFYIIINIILSLSLILLNKWIYLRINFPNLSLTLIHFICTFIGLLIMKRMNLFAHKSINSHNINTHLLSLLSLAITFSGFVVFTNLSLEYNTIGSYQIIKTLTFPTIIIIQTHFYEKVFSFYVKLTLVWIVTILLFFCLFNITFS